MPTYEYTCKSCGKNIEVFQPFSARPLKKHKECGGELQKVFHARGVVFKGPGFYATDSRNGSSKKSDDGDSPKTETKKETKAASKKKEPVKETSSD